MCKATWSGRRGRSFRRGAVLVWAAVTVSGFVALPTAGPAAADPLSSAKAEAAAVTAQLHADGDRLDIASQELDAAQQKVQQLQQQQASVQAQIATAKEQVGADAAALRQQALIAYMTGATGSSLSSLFSTGGEQASATQEYTAVADGTLGTDIDRLHRAQTLLGADQQTLATDAHQAQQALAAAESAQQAAAAAQAAEQATLDGLNGQIATLVAQQEAAEQAAQEAAFVAAQSAGPAGGAVSDLPVAQGAAGAVQAAESQLGVPYIYGAEDPGVGFDCSGLTQWAWGRAGVSLPRTAAEQYDAIPHIPLSDLEPGDLLFWNDGTDSIQHVAMYVGNNEVIQAPETGETVSYSSIWYSGLVGAGRP